MLDYNFKRTAMDNWMETLYGAFPKYYLDTLQDILQDNTRLHENLPQPTDIMYVRGTAYSINVAPIGSNPARYEVHPDIEHRVKQLFTEKAEIADEEVIVQGYLRRLLNLCEVREDMVLLMSDNIKSNLLPNTENYCYSNATVKEDKCKEFIKRNKQFSDLIAERLLTNILLAG